MTEAALKELLARHGKETIEETETEENPKT